MLHDKICYCKLSDDVFVHHSISIAITGEQHILTRINKRRFLQAYIINVIYSTFQLYFKKCLLYLHPSSREKKKVQSQQFEPSVCPKARLSFLNTHIFFITIEHRRQLTNQRERDRTRGRAHNTRIVSQVTRYFHPIHR